MASHSKGEAQQRAAMARQSVATNGKGFALHGKASLSTAKAAHSNKKQGGFANADRI